MPPWPCLPLDIGKAFKEGGEAVWGASPISAAQPVALCSSGFFLGGFSAYDIVISVENTPEIVMFRHFGLAPTFVASASQPQIEVLFLDF